MEDTEIKEREDVSPSNVCHRAFELMAAKQYVDAERLVTGNMAKTVDATSVALYHSVLGVLFKMQGEYKTAWKHYERAEKLLPNDPALKIISARLLISQFAEYSQAIKKAKKVLELIPQNPVFVHQAYTTMGLAYAKKGERKKAGEMLRSSIVEDFMGFITARNIDFELVEATLKRSWNVDICREFLDKALSFAETTGEGQFITIFAKMLGAFDVDFPNATQIRSGVNKRDEVL